MLVDAVVAAVPRNLGEVVGSADASQGMIALAVEVPPSYVGVVGEADAVSVGVLDGSAAFPNDQIEPSRRRPPGAANRAQRRRPPTTTVEQPANLDGPTTIPSMLPTTTGPQG